MSFPLSPPWMLFNSLISEPRDAMFESLMVSHNLLSVLHLKQVVCHSHLLTWRNYLFTKIEILLGHHFLLTIQYRPTFQAWLTSSPCPLLSAHLQKFLTSILCSRTKRKENRNHSPSVAGRTSICSPSPSDDLRLNTLLKFPEDLYVSFCHQY